MIVQIFSNVDMRLSHPGLKKLCKEHDLDVDLLDKGEYVVFVNSAKTMLKMMSTAKVFAYLRVEKPRRIDMTIIKQLPSYFKAGAVDYDKALKDKIAKELQVHA